MFDLLQSNGKTRSQNYSSNQMKKLLLPSILAIALMPTFSSQAQNDSCFMVLANGKRVNLAALCRQDSSSNTRPQQTVTPVSRPTSPTNPTLQTGSQPKQSRCPVGFKITRNETCRNINAPLLSVEDLKLIDNPDNQYLPYISYTIRNLIETPISVSQVVIRFTSPSGVKTGLFFPNTVLQPNESTTFKEITSAIYSLGVKANNVTLSPDSFEASEKN